MAALRLLLSALVVAPATALLADKDSENISYANSSYTGRNNRLPDDVEPIHYNIKLIPYIEEGNFTFDGESSITIWIRRSRNTLSLHSLNLTIDEAATKLITTTGNRYYVPTSQTYDILTQSLVIEFDTDLSPEVYILNMKFVGTLHTDLNGFYRTSYRTKDTKETRWLAATHFEATWARRAFPCWDEPALKATFNISIKHYRHYTALSNMPMREQTDDDNNDGMIWTHFEETPVMSTYLVAFTVSDFVRVPTEDSTVNIWCRPAVVPHVNFLARVVTPIERIMTQYTNTNYTVPKMDHFLSRKYLFAAMENWGLIIYNEVDVIFNEEKDSITKKQEVAKVAAHEMAHQWFGNIISPLWWSDVWLNEGFATFFAEYVLNVLFREWRRYDYFVVNTLQPSLERDFENKVTSITFDVNISEENVWMFLSRWSNYAKAPSILRMLEHVLTNYVFRKGILKYIRNHQFDSVTTDDFWCALQEALDRSDVQHGDYNVKQVMDTWIKKRHYPVVHVTRNYDTGDIIMTQEHCCLRNSTKSLDDKWWIPITFATQSNPDFSQTVPSHWLKPHDHNITIKEVDTNDWIIVNVQETGYYRVQYDYTNWWRIVKYLNSDNYKKIHVINRAQLIDDFSHLLTTIFEQELFSELIKYIRKENDFVTYVPAIKLLRKHRTFFKLSESNSVKSHILRMLSAFVKKVGYEEDPNDDDNKKINRASVLELACTFGHTECRKMAAIKLNNHLADPETHKVSPNLRDWMFCTGMAEATASTLHTFIEKYNNIAHESFLDYLACSEKPEVLNNILYTYVSSNDSAKTNSKYKRLFTIIVEKHADNDLVLDYLLANINKTISRGYTVEDIFTEIANNIYSTERLEKIINFVQNNFDDDIFKQAKTTIDERKAKLSELIAKYTYKI